MYNADWKIEDFRAWLTAMPETAIVGTTSNSRLCPLARWREELGEKVAVDPGFVEVVGDDSSKTKLPDWATIFVTEIDEYYLDDNGYSELPVAAYACLEVLPSS